jgi:two-component system chemotaxis response regulator CheY
MIVDDSAVTRKILHRVLVLAQLPLGQVHEASDGREALQKLLAAPVGLILTDINMPNMDGLELLSAVKALDAYKNVPIFMITAEGSQEKVIQAIQLGAAGYVRKPFTPEQIREKLVGIV